MVLGVSARNGRTHQEFGVKNRWWLGGRSRTRFMLPDPIFMLRWIRILSVRSSVMIFDITSVALARYVNMFSNYYSILTQTSFQLVALHIPTLQNRSSPASLVLRHTTLPSRDIDIDDPRYISASLCAFRDFGKRRELPLFTWNPWIREGEWKTLP